MFLKFLTLAYWNGLVSAHMGDVVMVLSATVLVLLDKPIWQLVNRAYRPKRRVMRFIVFVAVCSFGYAALAVVASKLLRWVLFWNGGAYIAPVAFGLLITIGIIAAKQKHI